MVKNYTKEQIDEMYEGLVVVDAFLFGIEITGQDDVYAIRQKLFTLKGFILHHMK